MDNVRFTVDTTVWLDGVTFAAPVAEQKREQLSFQEILNGTARRRFFARGCRIARRFKRSRGFNAVCRRQRCQNIRPRNAAGRRIETDDVSNRAAETVALQYVRSPRQTPRGGFGAKGIERRQGRKDFSDECGGAVSRQQFGRCRAIPFAKTRQPVTRRHQCDKSAGGNDRRLSPRFFAEREQRTNVRRRRLVSRSDDPSAGRLRSDEKSPSRATADGYQDLGAKHAFCSISAASAASFLSCGLSLFAVISISVR